MAYPTTGAEGSVVSWGSSNFYSTLLARHTPMEASVTVESPEIDITGLGASTETQLADLYSWSAELQGMAFAPPRSASVGSVAFSAGGYALYVRSFDVTLAAREVDITSLTSSPTARVWRPDGPIKITGTINAIADSATALAMPAYRGTPASFPTLTLTYGSGALLKGGAMLRQMGVTVRKGSDNIAVYQFAGSGTWTSSGTATSAPLFGMGSAIGIPLWSYLSTVQGALKIATKTGSRFLSGADSFWRSIRLQAAVGSPAEVFISVRGTGALSSV